MIIYLCVLFVSNVVDLGNKHDLFFFFDMDEFAV